jgi:epimerase transport system membrane fusion protein
MTATSVSAEVARRLWQLRPSLALLRARDAPDENRAAGIAPDCSLRPLAATGGYVLAAFFGLFLGWLALAPLNGAVVASGVVKSDGNRKTVQHPDGGLVAALHVREGDRVAKGDPLIVLESTQIRAEHAVLSEQYMVLRFTQLRLNAELSDIRLEYPAEFAQRANDAAVKTLWKSQSQQLESRRVSLAGQRSIISEKISQHNQVIRGAEAQLAGLRVQIESIDVERETLRPLLEKGLVTRPRFAQLERTAAQLEGQIGQTASQIAQARVAIEEQRRLSTQLGNERLSEVTKELKETQASLVEIVPKLNAARAALDRLVLRSPYEGRVVGLTAFSVGGVIARGEKLMDIVPDDADLVVDAQIAVDQISDVRPGQGAAIHLIAFADRETPIIDGQLISISADRLTDQHTRTPYYAAVVKLSAKSLARFSEVRLYPGMPVTIMVPTRARSALRYLLDPLLRSLSAAGRQR